MGPLLAGISLGFFISAIALQDLTLAIIGGIVGLVAIFFE